MNNNMTNEQTIISCKNISKSFNDGKLNVDVLKGVYLSVKAGEKLAIVGSSGSGKSTLLHILGGLDLPSEGEVNILGNDIANLSGEEQDENVIPVHTLPTHEFQFIGENPEPRHCVVTVIKDVRVQKSVLHIMPAY